MGTVELMKNFVGKLSKKGLGYCTAEWVEVTVGGVTARELCSILTGTPDRIEMASKGVDAKEL